MVDFFIYRVDNIVGKGENAGYQHFLLFRQCYQKASFPGLLKHRTVWERDNYTSLSQILGSSPACSFNRSDQWRSLVTCLLPFYYHFDLLFKARKGNESNIWLVLFVILSFLTGTCFSVNFLVFERQKQQQKHDWLDVWCFTPLSTIFQ